MHKYVLYLLLFIFWVISLLAILYNSCPDDCVSVAKFNKIDNLCYRNFNKNQTGVIKGDWGDMYRQCMLERLDTEVKKDVGN